MGSKNGNDKRRLSGDWTEESYKEWLNSGPSYLDAYNVLESKEDDGFYGHLKGNSIKKGKVKGSCK